MCLQHLHFDGTVDSLLQLLSRLENDICSASRCFGAHSTQFVPARLQVLYSLPELDGAIDTVPLGGLVGDNIFLVRERVRRLCARISRWVSLRRTAAADRKVAMLLYGFPPGVGATGTAALLNVPASLERALGAMRDEARCLSAACSACLLVPSVHVHLCRTSCRTGTRADCKPASFSQLRVRCEVVSSGLDQSRMRA